MNLVDSCGWLEFFGGGPHSAFFGGPIEDPQRLIVPSICIFEVFKSLCRQLGRSAGLEAVAAMRQGRVIPLDSLLAMQAASVSLELKLPMADSVVLATARVHHATLWTQDAHFEAIPEVRYRPKTKKS